VHPWNLIGLDSWPATSKPVERPSERPTSLIVRGCLIHIASRALRLLVAINKFEKQYSQSECFPIIRLPRISLMSVFRWPLLKTQRTLVNTVILKSQPYYTLISFARFGKSTLTLS
jgi:hypothetical protein